MRRYRRCGFVLVSKCRTCPRRTSSFFRYGVFFAECLTIRIFEYVESSVEAYFAYYREDKLRVYEKETSDRFLALAAALSG